MAVEYAAVDCDAPVLQYKFTHPTVAEAAGAAHLGDYVVAVENGVVRPLNADENAELQQYTHTFKAV
jgi:hypothetical protein